MMKNNYFPYAEEPGFDNTKNLTSPLVTSNRRDMLHANPLQPLQNLIDLGLQPARREFCMFLDMAPNRSYGLRINTAHLPTDDDCLALAGLDIVLHFHGYVTKYGPLRRLCGSILAARPNLFWILDRDFKKIAHLKFEEAHVDSN